MSHNHCPQCAGDVFMVDDDVHGPVWCCQECTWAGPEASTYYTKKDLSRLSGMEVVALVSMVALFVVIVSAGIVALFI